MKKRILWLTGLLLLFVPILHVGTALAHESITVGDYEIVVGWVTEPPIAGQMNGIEIHVSDTSTGTEQPVEDVSSLTLSVAYGGQAKTLTLEAMGEESPGQFTASLIPTIPGEYMVRFGGTLGDTPVDAETHIHEVQPVESLAFPDAESPQQETNSFGMTEWLAILGFLSGLAGLILSLLNMRNRRG
jgi:hypothetical protein